MIRFLLFFPLLIISSCGYVGHIRQDNESLEKAVAELAPLKEEIYNFRDKNNIFPEKLSDLSKNNLFRLRKDANRTTYSLKGYSYAPDGYELNYYKHKEGDGFTLKVWGIKSFMHLGNMFLCFRWLEYNTEQKYPPFPEYRVDKRIGGWAQLNHCEA